MNLIKLNNVSKVYNPTKPNKKEVIKNINLSFKSKCMVFILGKSGSGKSTLLNIIGGIDKPSKGDISYTSLKKFISRNHNPLHISYVFQHYYLLDEETSLNNVMIPAMIHGLSKKEAYKISQKLLTEIGFTKNTINNKASLLSGGEKQRVALLRSIVTNPDIILADEPTGALDSSNAILVMDTLKKESKNRLVIVVTHNKKLAEKYADRIIEIKDGQIAKDEVINEVPETQENKRLKKKHNDAWSNIIIEHNFRKRIKRNFVSIFSFALSLIFSFLLIGFSTNYKSVLSNVEKMHLDYGSCVVSKEEKRDTESSIISLIKTSRPEKEEIENIIKIFPMFSYALNYDIIIGNYNVKTVCENDLTLSINMVKNFSENYIDNSLLLYGRIPENNNEVLINKKANEVFNFQNRSVNDDYLDFSSHYEFVFNEIDNNTSKDLVDINQRFTIVGVVDELDFLSTEKVYMANDFFDDYFNSKIMENYSIFRGETYTWKSLVNNAGVNDKHSSYSYRLFLNDISEIDKVKELNFYLKNDIKMTNNSLEINEALESFIQAADLGLKLFLIIVLIGSILIVTIFGYSSYCDDKKSSAILYCLGASFSKIIELHLSENMIIGIFGFVISIIASYFLQNPLNILVYKFTKLPNLISIPFASFLGRKFFLPIAAFVCIIFIITLSTLLPIFFSKKLSVKEELADI